MTDPRLLATPTGSAGLTMVKMAPHLGASSDSLHSTYPISFMAPNKEAIGGLAGSVPWHILARDPHADLMQFADKIKFAERSPYYVMQGMPEGVRGVQRVDSQLADAVSKFFEQYPKGW